MIVNEEEEANTDNLPVTWPRLRPSHPLGRRSLDMEEEVVIVVLPTYIRVLLMVSFIVAPLGSKRLEVVDYLVVPEDLKVDDVPSAAAAAIHLLHRHLHVGLRSRRGEQQKVVASLSDPEAPQAVERIVDHYF